MEVKDEFIDQCGDNFLENYGEDYIYYSYYTDFDTLEYHVCFIGEDLSELTDYGLRTWSSLGQVLS